MNQQVQQLQPTPDQSHTSSNLINISLMLARARVLTAINAESLARDIKRKSRDLMSVAGINTSLRAEDFTKPQLEAYNWNLKAHDVQYINEGADHIGKIQLTPDGAFIEGMPWYAVEEGQRMVIDAQGDHILPFSPSEGSHPGSWTGLPLRQLIGLIDETNLPISQPLGREQLLLVIHPAFRVLHHTSHDQLIEAARRLHSVGLEEPEAVSHALKAAFGTIDPAAALAISQSHASVCAWRVASKLVAWEDATDEERTTASLYLSRMAESLEDQKSSKANYLAAITTRDAAQQSNPEANIVQIALNASRLAGIQILEMKLQEARQAHQQALN